MPLSPGARLGPHEILQPIGSGGMGEVYRARDTRLGREVAVKVLPGEVASDRERLARFEREARSASALNHPNIVTIHEIGRHDSTLYIVMELVEGSSLRELLASGPLPVRKILQIASQAAEGLACAHEAGIVHRDLKPENLMVSKEGFVKILDFGLAKATAPRSEEMSSFETMEERTAAGVVLGTVGYMSPEQAAGRPVDFRSDQFSFGSVLYEMAAGKRAFQRGTAVETLAAILQCDFEPVGALNAALPAPLCWIVERCLAREPEARYHSTRDLSRDIAAVRERLSEARLGIPTESVVNLPTQRTRFVGRERERSAVKELLSRPDVRLMTLTGPGGIGKTRLSLQVAEELVELFPGGVCFVPLETVSSPDLLASAISQNAGIREKAGESALETVKEHLQTLRAPMLLLLDNFEHLASGASIVSDLVAAGSQLKVLVTGRSPLHVYGEQEFPVPPLALPDLATLPSLDALSEYEAVALFLQRAAAVKPDFALTRENAPSIVEICARLDGLPLAIELAAARVKLLPPAAMRARLESRLQLLTGGARDLPARQQTLRGAIEWSHDLLDAAEQKLFRRLSVFVGGCTLEAVEAVCNAKTDLGLDVLDGMASMVDKSLVLQIETDGGEPRFVMLETIREFARERLAGSGDEPITRRAHAAYCIVLAEEEGSGGHGGADSGWLERFDVEHDNFRAALDWLTDQGNAEWSLRLAAALFRYWEAREYIAEGRERLTTALKLSGAESPSKPRARALFAAGVLAGAQKDYAAARELLEEALRIDRELADKWGVAVTLNALAVTALDARDVVTSRRLSEEVLALWRELGDRMAVARSLVNLASVAKVQGDYEFARSLYEEAISIFRERNDPTAVARVLNHQGDLAREQGDFEAAGSLYERSLVTFREFGDRWGVAGCLADMGSLALERGEFSAADSLYRESLEIFHGLEHKRGIARVLEHLACSAAARGRSQRALKLAGAAAALRQALGTPLPPAEQAGLEKGLEPARRALGREGAAAWMEGWATPIEEAVAEALAIEAG